MIKFSTAIEALPLGEKGFFAANDLPIRGLENLHHRDIHYDSMRDRLEFNTCRHRRNNLKQGVHILNI